MALSVWTLKFVLFCLGSKWAEPNGINGGKIDETILLWSCLDYFSLLLVRSWSSRGKEPLRPSTSNRFAKTFGRYIVVYSQKTTLCAVRRSGDRTEQTKLIYNQLPDLWNKQCAIVLSLTAFLIKKNRDRPDIYKRLGTRPIIYIYGNLRVLINNDYLKRVDCRAITFTYLHAHCSRVNRKWVLACV